MPELDPKRQETPQNTRGDADQTQDHSIAEGWQRYVIVNRSSTSNEIAPVFPEDEE